MTEQTTIKLHPYQKIATQILQRILSGEFEAGDQLVPVRSFAKQYRVSIFTVGKALDLLREQGHVEKRNRSGVFVTEPTTKRTMGSRVGILVPHLPSQVAGSFLRTGLEHIQQELMETGNQVSVHACYWHSQANKTVAYIPASEFARSGLDLLVLGGIYDFHYCSDLARLGLPIVAMDVDVSSLGIDSVFFDNHSAAFELTRLLLDKGHREIAFVGGPLPIRFAALHEPDARSTSSLYDPVAMQRVDGYRSAMRTFAPDLSIHVFHSPRTRSPEDYMETAAEALKSVPGLTAIVSERSLPLGDLGAERVENVFFQPEVPRDGETPPGTNVPAYAVCDFENLGRATGNAIQERLRDPTQPIQRLTVSVPVRSLRNP